MIFVTPRYVQSDYSATSLAESYLVKAYATSPRLIITSQVMNEDDDFDVMIDLLKDNVTVYAYLGQNRAMDDTFLGNRGVMESRIEGLALERMTGKPARTTKTVFDVFATMPDGEIVILYKDTLPTLATLNLSAEADWMISDAIFSPKRAIISSKFDRRIVL